MSTILTYGLKNPQNGDPGSSFFPDLNFDIARIDAHNHDGSNSALLTSQSINPVSASVSSAGWLATGSSGNYRQVVTTPPSIDFDAYGLSVRTSAGIEINPTIEKITDTTFYIYVNDNALNLTLLYLV